MRFAPSAVTRISVLAVFFSAALTISMLGRSSVPGSAAQGGIAYDEVMRFVRSDQPTPQPGGFPQDFQAAVDAQRGAGSTQHHGMFGAIMNAASAVKGAMMSVKTGLPSSHYFYNGWERTDDPGKQTATISRPDRRQMIYLDLAKKTYRVVDMSTAAPETAAPYAPPNEQGEQPSPQPGTGKLDISESSLALGPKTIDSVATSGYAQDFKMTATESTGSCQNGSFEVSMISYVSRYAMPSAGPNPVTKVHLGAPSPQAFTTKPGCNPKMTLHHARGASPPSDRLYLWTLTTIKGEFQSNQGQGGGSVLTLIERGDVRVLGTSDAGLFDIPAGFTKES